MAPSEGLDGEIAVAANARLIFAENQRILELPGRLLACCSVPPLPGGTLGLTVSAPEFLVTTKAPFNYHRPK
jgi:hypothetical protein